MPCKLKDLGKLCESLEVIINWLIQLILIIVLNDCVCKLCNFGHFGLRKDTSFSRDCMEMLQQKMSQKRVRRTCRFEKDLGLKIII